MLSFTVTIDQLSVFINTEVIRAPFQDLWQVPLNFQERIFFILLWLPSPIRFDSFCEYSNLAIALFSVCKTCPLIDFVFFPVRFDQRDVVFSIASLKFRLNSSAWDLRIYKAATSVGAITSKNWAQWFQRICDLCTVVMVEIVLSHVMTLTNSM